MLWGETGRNLRAYRTGRCRKDYSFPHSHHIGASRWRKSGSLRAGCGEELQRDTPAGRIYAGTFFLIPGFVRRRESHFLCHAFQYHYPGELRIGKGYLPTNRTFQTPACRKTIRRHETKAGSELRIDSQAFHTVLGRTYHRCGPCIQKGVLGHAAEIETRRSYHHCGNALPERDEMLWPYCIYPWRKDSRHWHSGPYSSTVQFDPFSWRALF